MNDNAATKQDLKELTTHFDEKFAALTALVTVGFETINDRFDRLEARMDELEDQMKDLTIRVRALEVGMREVSLRLENIDGRLSALEADVKELYRLSRETRRMFAAQLKVQPEQEKRLKRLEVFADSTAKRLGLKFS